MPIQIPQITPQQFIRHPISYALVIVAGLLSFFVSRYSSSQDQGLEACEGEKKELRIDLLQERKRNDDLIQALLVKNGIINEIKKTTDSLVREKAGAESINILKQQK